MSNSHLPGDDDILINVGGRGGGGDGGMLKVLFDQYFNSVSCSFFFRRILNRRLLYYGTCQGLNIPTEAHINCLTSPWIRYRRYFEFFYTAKNEITAIVHQLKTALQLA